MFKFSTCYLRFLLTGVFFTIFGPFLFLLISVSLAPVLTSVLVECLVHCFRYFVYSRYVFVGHRSDGVRTYISAALPVALLNIGFVAAFVGTVGRLNMAIVLGLFGASAGYFWTKICYRYDLSSRLRDR
jgi:hypothetical protein